jgi:type II secretory ATPase GspE/PulE/Tfp pilus assembly ATPase PilB-like protein
MIIVEVKIDELKHRIDVRQKPSLRKTSELEKRLAENVEGALKVIAEMAVKTTRPPE